MPHNALIFLSRHKAHQIERMAAQIAQRARTRLRLMKAPHTRRAELRQAPRLGIFHIHMVDFPQCAPAHQVARIARRRLIAIREAHHGFYACLLHRPGQGVGLLRRERERLFHAKRFPRLGRRHCHLKVYIVGRGNIHHIHIFAGNQIPVIPKTTLRRNAICLPCRLQGILPNVAHRRQFQIRTCGNTGQMHAPADAANANASHPNPSHTIRTSYIFIWYSIVSRTNDASLCPALYRNKFTKSIPKSGDRPKKSGLAKAFCSTTPKKLHPRGGNPLRGHNTVSINPIPMRRYRADNTSP